MKIEIKDFIDEGDNKLVGFIVRRDEVYETVTKQRQKVVVSTVEEDVSNTEVVLEDGKYVEKTTTETVTKEVEVPQHEEKDLYDEDGEVIGKHQVPIMEDYEEEVLVKESGLGFAIDRYVPISEGKSDEDYISDAYAALGRNGISAKDEIDDWAENYVDPDLSGNDKKLESPKKEVSENIGKKWTVEDGIL